MKILFSPEYSGPVYLKDPDNAVLMDTVVVNTVGLLSLVEFQLGLQYDDVPTHDRIAKYYSAMREYIDETPDSIFAKSFKLSGLGTAKAVLSWRDSLSMAQWDFKGEEISARLKAIIDIEKYFSKYELIDISSRVITAVSLLSKNKGLCCGWKLEMPVGIYDVSQPIVRILVDAILDAGASEIILDDDGISCDNLGIVRRIASNSEIEKQKLNHNDDSFQIWKFPDEHCACRYLAAKGDNLADVWISPSNKEMDNWLGLMGKPLSGSVMGKCAPQLTQLFVLGLGLFGNPLNINLLVEWLNLPIQPLERNFRIRLSSTIAKEGGFRNESCHQLVEKYIDGAYVYLDSKQKQLPIEEQDAIRKKNRKTRIKKVSLFLPSFKPENDEIEIARIKDFTANLSSWTQQRIQMMDDDPDNLYFSEQLGKVAEMCDALEMLLDTYPFDRIGLSLIDSWVSNIYREQNFTHAVPQADGRIIVDSPAKIISKVDWTIWLGLETDQPECLDCAFLYPSEREKLTCGDHIHLWETENEIKYHQLNQIIPVMRTKKQLILVVCERIGGEQTEKHPLMIRLEQSIDNLDIVTLRPFFEDSELIEIKEYEGDTVPSELHFDFATSLKWPGHISPTDISTLVEHPFDYLMEHLLKITYDEKAQIDDIKRTEGNVAHAVIEKLFSPDEDGCDGTYDTIAHRIDNMYEQVFNDMVEAHGAVLQLSENRIEAKYLYKKLRKNLDILLQIIHENNLCVTGCEKFLEDRLNLGLPPEYDSDGNAKDRDMRGFIDMTLKDEFGNPIVFDFKWTSSKSYYQDLLSENRSIQLELYRYMLGNAEEKEVRKVAYFLMPRARLYSKEDFIGQHCTKIEPSNYDNIVEQLRNAAIFRKHQIDSGVVETNGLFSELHYVKHMQEKNLYPLKEREGLKESNRFSNYGLFSDSL